MKKFLMLIFLASNIAYSQNCELFVKTEYDKMAQKNITSQIEVLSIVSPDGTGGIGVFMRHSERSKALILSFKAEGMLSNCVDEGSKVEILFRSGEKFTWRGENRFNCDGEIHVWATTLKGWRREMEYMSTNPVETIRVNGVKNYMQVDLSEDESFTLQNLVRCMWIY